MNVGLTGGIGCGKSTVAGCFRLAGWRVIETDQVVRELLAGDVDVQAAIRGRWGAALFGMKGRVDRAAIARLVFEDEEELRWLETLLHPRVRAVWEEAIAVCRSRCGLARGDSAALRKKS